MTIEAAIESEFLHVVISMHVLLFAAKIFAKIFARLKLPIVLGELVAGIIVGPFALGGLLIFNGEPPVVLDETLEHIGEISAIVILFILCIYPIWFTCIRICACRNSLDCN
jgi:Kef-type K+ transport system membrane component KefB